MDYTVRAIEVIYSAKFGSIGIVRVYSSFFSNIKATTKFN